MQAQHAEHANIARKPAKWPDTFSNVKMSTAAMILKDLEVPVHAVASSTEVLRNLESNMHKWVVNLSLIHI